MLSSSQENFERKEKQKTKQICFLHIGHTEEISDRNQTLWIDCSDIQNSFGLSVHLWNFCVLKFSLRVFLRYLEIYQEITRLSFLISVVKLCLKHVEIQLQSV